MEEMLTSMVNMAVLSIFNPFKVEVDAAVDTFKMTVTTLTDRITKNSERVNVSTAAVEALELKVVDMVGAMENKVVELIDASTRRINSKYGHITRNTFPALADMQTDLARHLNVLKERLPTHSTTDHGAVDVDADEIIGGE
jgi:hypothetical protein